jgi:periplasmic glucans biosynthesis protein
LSRGYRLDRRTLLGAGALLPLLAQLNAARAADPGGPAAPPPNGTPFTATTVRELAQALAAKPFQPQETALPAPLAHLDYNHYRMIRFKPEDALWQHDQLPFQLQLFHRGYLFTGRVDIDMVEAGQAHPLPYDPSYFTFGSLQVPNGADLGFAGFRIHSPINRPDYYDEICAFLGASYFRAVARFLGYGLSARGLAIRTADPTGEEFPYFRHFWIEKPQPQTQGEPANFKPPTIVVHALLESQSATGAFRFAIMPGVQTIFDVNATVFPRVDIAEVGIAPLTSMFLFDSNDRMRIDDWRSAVHDSNGLLMHTGQGETLWRPLANPQRLQVSMFADSGPRGFGLVQRKRSLADYGDLEAHYENRPSLWIEPRSNWGEGSVVLVEIPTQQEINDNIVAFWRPKEKLQAQRPYTYDYRMYWCATPDLSEPPAPILRTMSGATKDGRMFVFDVANVHESIKPELDLTSDKGKLRNGLVQPGPDPGGWRVSFEMVPGNEKVVELHARLMSGKTPISETWLYRWTS